MSRKAVAAVMSAFALLAVGLPSAVADQIDFDSDVVTAGVQTTAINLTAAPGQVLTVPVDLFITCKTRQHIAGPVTVRLRDAGASGSVVPTGGSLSAAPVVVNRPTGWPADNSACGDPAPTTQPARANLQLAAPATLGLAQYITRWDASDPDATSGNQDAQITINLTVANPTPTDSTPPIITRTVSGTQGNNGWFTSSVTVTWSVTDAQSGVVIDSGCGVQNFTNETVAAASSCVAHSAGGSASDAVALKIDKSGPSAVLSPSGTLGQNGWFTSSVTLHASGQDAVSGSVVCTADQTQSAETTGATFNASCTNAAGLSTSAAPLTVKVDKTGPVAGLAVTTGTLGSGGWYTSDVTVRASGTDPVSGGVTCSADQTLTTDTTGTPVTGSCVNAAGLSTDAAPVTVKLDKTNPSATLTVTAGTLGTNGWYVDDVTVHASGSDDVSDPTACDPDQYQTLDTAGHVFAASCTNDAGRTQAADPLTIKRDATAPTAHLEVLAGTPGDNGWYTSAVTVRTVGDDTTSGVVCTPNQVLDADTVGTTVTGSCINGAGLRTDAAPITIKIDRTGPTAVTTVSAGELGANGWYTSDVTLHTTGADSISGPVTCAADQHQTVETAGQTFTGSCTDAAGLSTVSDPVTVRLDKSGPSAVLSPSGTLGDNGWYVSDVSITTVGQDDISGSVSCSDDQQQAVETPGATFHGLCVNGAGLATDATPLTVKVDKTAPAATLSVTAGHLSTNGWYTTDVTVHTDGSDDMSGPVACSEDQVMTTDTAHTDVHGSCTNAAGLSANAAPLTIKLDKSNPTAYLSVTSGDLGDDGWYVNDVTVHTAGADNVSDPTACTSDQPFADDDAARVFHGSCTNSAGLTQEAEPLTLKRDSTPPTAKLVVTGSKGANGWYTSDVTVTVAGADPTSGASCHGGATLTGETTGIEVTGSCTNGAGLATDADPVTIKIDKTAPDAALSVISGTLGDNGWFTTDVTLRTSGSDDVSGPVVCTADQQQTDETTGHTFHGSCTDDAGLVGHADGLLVKLDKSAPATSLSVTAGTLGAHGWYTSDVTVHSAGIDDVSGVASCTVDQQQTTETPGQVFTGSCTNRAGLSSGDQLEVKLDKTGPSAMLATAGTAGVNGWFTGDVTVTTSGTDDVSGPATCTGVQEQKTETVGRDFHGSCTNQAGLETPAHPVTVKLDKTAPSATETVTAGDVGTNGWYTSDVTVGTDGGDDVSAPVSCTDDQVLSSDTTGTVVSGSCTNSAGLVGHAAPITIKVDKTNPSAELSVSRGTLGSHGWYTDDVTVHTSGSDDVSDPTTCTADQFQTTDTSATGHDFHGSCTNDAGRTQEASVLDVKRDASPPTAHLEVVSGTAGDHGWYTSDVTVRAVGDDAQSGATCSVDVTLTHETAGTTVNGSCTNGAGLTTSAAPLMIKIDKTGPSAGLHVTAGTTGANGWYVSDVTVATSGADALSGPVSCTADQALGVESTGTTFNGQCTNDAGLTTNAAPLTVKLDKSAPTASLSVTTGTTGMNGWFVSTVTATTTGDDAISGPTSCTPAWIIAADTPGTVVQASCTNSAGLTTQAVPLTIKLDKTPPVVTVVNVSPSYVVGSVPMPACTTTDTTSGVAVQATPSVPALTGVGTYTATCAGAVDKAGNTGSATATFASVYGFNGFLQPVNDTAHQVGLTTSIFKAGSTVPLKFQLRRADGSLIQPTSSPQWLSPVKGSPTTAAVDESVYSDSASSGTTYRFDTDQWIYNWSTKGLAAGYYYRVGVKLDDGQTYYVNVGLR